MVFGLFDNSNQKQRGYTDSDDLDDLLDDIDSIELDDLDDELDGLDADLDDDTIDIDAEEL